jgi:hypothetical protein
MSLADQLAQIKASINEAERELISLSSGRKISASRVRKQLQNVKTQSQLLRKAVIVHTKELPTKKRPAKIVPEPVEEIPKLELVEPEPQSTLTGAPSTLPKPKKKRIAKSKKV